MKLPGPLIEYLINGSVAMIWLFPFLKAEMQSYEGASIILIPIIYVLGMFVDLIAFVVTKIPKKQIRIFVEKRYLGKNNKYYPGIGKDMKINVLTKSPELAKEIETRSGRDRIARGMIINTLFMLFFSSIVSWWICTVLLILSIVMWISFEYASHGFILRAYENCKDDNTNKKLGS